MVSRAGLVYAVICLFTLLSPALLCLQSAKSESIASIVAAAGLQAGDTPGGAVLVVKDERIVFEQGYGVTDLKSLRKIDAKTNFRLASVTKQFTAMAIMLLVHDGKLRYDDRLSDIFPDFPPYGRTITIRNLLNHTSGLLDYEDLMPHPDPKLPVEQTQIQDASVLDLMKQQKGTKFASGSKWAYSNSGYVVLGLIVQQVSGKSFPDFLHDRIFAPLGMTGTIAYVRGKNEATNRAYGHTLEEHRWTQTDQSPTSATLGDGGVYSSLADMAKWDQALRQNKLLSKAGMQPAFTAVDVPGVTGPDSAPAQYGFGWFLNPYKNHPRTWHYGETIGFRTALQRFTDDGLTVVILCNRAGIDPTRIALAIADLYVDAFRKQ